MTRKIVLTSVLLFLILAAASIGGGRGQRPTDHFAQGYQLAGAPPRAEPAGARIQADLNFGRMPLYFIPNKGQIEGAAAYYIQGKDKTLYFCDEGLTFVLREQTTRGSKEKMLDSKNPALVAGPAESEKPGRSWTVKLDFVGANTSVRPQGRDETGAVISYFKGPEKDWKTGLPSYSKIAYRELWPGIDLVFSGNMNELKYEFVVKPGADPSLIRLRYRGAEKVAIDKYGRLEVTTPVASFKDGVPIAWQETAGGKKDVSLAYDLAIKTAIDEPDFSYGLKVGAYDPALPLVLDPVVIVYCGYIGGSSGDNGYGIAVDRWGCAYLTGYTQWPGTTFPVKVGPDLTFNGWDNDSFVAKVKADGSGLVYCGFIGGADYGVDYAWGIAVDASGCAYISGETQSTQASFPVTVGPDLTHSGGADAYVAKVNADGTRLVYCGYIGGTSGDWGREITVDSSGCAYVVGITDSTETSFPVRSGPDLSFNGTTAGDAFVAKVRADGTGLVYCGYIGGSSGDAGQGIAMDSSGCAYVSGTTYSSEATFPVIVGPCLTHNGGADAFVAKVKADGTGLIYCGYVGGSDNENVGGIAVDGSGCAYLTGSTRSTETSFPVTVGPDLTYNGGDPNNFEYGDAFVAKIKSDGSGLVYCGYIGGSKLDAGEGIAMDGSGCAHLAGFTYSTEATFPVSAGPDLTYNGDGDAFIAKVKANGTGLIYCGYLGGTVSEEGHRIAVDGASCAYVTGYSSSPEASFPVTVGPDLTLNGGCDVFVAKIKMISGWLRVTSPNGGEKWPAGSKHPINWESSFATGHVRIFYSSNSGQKWTTVAPGTLNDGRYFWTVPNTVSAKCLARIDKFESDATDQSNNVFAIVPAPTIKVVFPNGGETWKAKTVHTIRWTTTGTLEAVKIEYSIDNGLNWTNIIASTSNTGKYSWTVPNKPSTACRVRIRKPGSTTPADMSNGKFTIIGL